VQRLKPPASPDLPGEAGLPPERGDVLAKEADESGGLFADPVAVDPDAVDDFLGRDEPSHLRADDSDFVAGIPQRACLLPHPAVERHRKIFDQDHDVMRHQQNPW
jgi:hypothetical protein